MANSSKRYSNTINTELTNDLQFLVLEVKQLFQLVKETITQCQPQHVSALEKRDNYIHNLKSRIETLSYEAIFKLKSKDKTLILNYRALIRISSNLERIADFLIQAGRQVQYVQDKRQFKSFNLNAIYHCIEEQLNKIHLAFTEVDKKLSEELCKSEVLLDELYLEQFNFIQVNISKKEMSSDMITLLFMVRYFERIGDCFLSIGESILNISIGDSLNIKYYEKLEAVVNDLTQKNETVHYEFKPFLFSRSGCKVGRLRLERISKSGKLEQKLFYKQGEKSKISAEIKGLKRWAKKVPETVPEIVWNTLDGNNSTLVVNYLKGENLLAYLLGESKNTDVKKVSQALQNKLEEVWTTQQNKKKKDSTFVQQVISRKQAIVNVHEDFFEEFKVGKKKKVVNFNQVLKDALQLEKKIQMPFRVLCHGDFNLDNIIYNPDKKSIHFIDVHRSGFNDYAQDVSVFIVSSLRIKLEDTNIKKKSNLLSQDLFAFAKTFAKKHNDDYFEARFAFGLFRSFITSTRFLHDDEWYQKMRMNALTVMEALQASKNNLKKFTFDLNEILD